MQYQVLLDPNRLVAYGVTVQQISDQLARTTPTRAAASTRRAASSTTCAASGSSATSEDIGNIVIATHNGIPVYVRDVATVTTGYAPRLGEFGFMHDNDAVEGVILMRDGRAGAGRAEEGRGDDGHAQQDRPAARREDRARTTTGTTLIAGDDEDRRGQPRPRHDASCSSSSGCSSSACAPRSIVAVTIPFALLFSFICLDWRHIPANLLSIGAIDFGMIVDGAVVMVENIFRELAARHGQSYNLVDVIRARGAGRRAADLLRDRRHHRGLPADLRADRAVGPALPADGRHDVVRAGRARCCAR